MKRAGDSLDRTNQAHRSEPQPSAQSASKRVRPTPTASDEFLGSSSGSPNLQKNTVGPSDPNVSLLPTRPAPLPSVDSKTQAYNTWLKTLGPAADEALVNFLYEKEVTLFAVPRHTDWYQQLFPDCPQITCSARHVGLLTGLIQVSLDSKPNVSDCNGNYEVARWVASTLKDCLPGQKYNNDTCDFFDKLTLTETERLSVTDTFRRLEPHLSSLQDLRDIARMSHAGIVTSDLSQSSWGRFEFLTTLYILSQLRAHGKAVIPADFAFFPEAPPTNWRQLKGFYPKIHATTSILEASEDRKSCAIHLIETNGRSDYLVRHSAADKVRRPTLPLHSPLQRQWTFSPADFKDSDFLAPAEFPHTQETPKIFAVRSTKASLSLLNKGFSMQGTVDYATDYLEVERISALLFPNQRKGFLSYEQMLSYQHKILERLSIDETVQFEPQRLYAAQRTPSCELKSTTVTAGLLLKDELSYQSLLGCLLMAAKAEAEQAKIPLTVDAKNHLQKDLEDVIKRIDDSRHREVQNQIAP